MALAYSTLTKPLNPQVVDPSTGRMREEWQLYFDGLTNRLNASVGALATDPAPADAEYFVAAADAGLTNEHVVSTFAQGLLDDADAAAARATIGAVNLAGDTMTGALTVVRTATNSSYISARANDDGAASGPQFTVDRNSASPAANDLIGKFIFRGRDSVGADTDYAYFQARIDDPTNGSEDASLFLGRLVAGAAVERTVDVTATDAEIRAATTGPLGVTAASLESASAIQNLSEVSGAVAVDWDTFINAIVTVDQNTVISNPTNGQAGTWRTIIVAGNDATDRTITFDSAFLGELPVITDCDSGRLYLLMIFCVNSTFFAVSAKRISG